MVRARHFTVPTHKLLITAFCGMASLGLAGCNATYTHRVSGVLAGNGGASSDLVMFSHSPVEDQDEIAMRMAASHASSRRDTALGDRNGAAYLPAGWWEERETPRIERPYWIHTSRNAESWSVPQRIETRREYESYWAR